MKFFPALLACPLALAAPAIADQPAQRTELRAEQTDMWTVGNETRIICTRGKDAPVTVTGTNLKIVCDRLEAVALGVGDKTSTAPVLEKFKYLLATGHVNIIQGDREAICGRAEVLPQEDKVELTENPVVIDHGSDWRQTGTKITMLRNQRRVIIENSNLTGPSLKDLGFDPKQAPPAPESAPKSPPQK